MPTLPFNSNPGQTTPITSEGDLIQGGADGSAERLPIGESGQVLTVQPTTHLLGEDCILCLPLRVNATDVGPNSFTVTNHGTVTFDATAGGSFNGTNQWLSIPHSDLMNLFGGSATIAFCASAASAGPSDSGLAVVSKIDEEEFDGGYYAAVDGNGASLDNYECLINNKDVIDSPGDYALNTRYAMVFSYDVDAQTITEYRNGSVVANATFNFNGANNDIPFFVGGFFDSITGTNGLFEGTIRDVLIASRAWTVNDALAHYNAGAGQSDGGLTVVVEDTALEAAWADLPSSGGGGGGGGTGTPNSQLIAGGGFSYLGNLQFRASAALVEILGVQYNIPQTDITLEAADATHPRIDIFVYTSSSTVIAIKGTAATNPAVPTYDPGTQLYAGYAVEIPALATTITAAQNVLIYDELGSAPEWTLTTDATGGGTWTALSTVNPLTGTKDLLGSAIALAGYAKFAPASPIDLGDYSSGGVLSIPIRIVSAWANKRGLQVQWYSGTATVGNAVNILNGSTSFYVFDSSATSAYQTLNLPLTAFGVPSGTTVDSLRVTVVGGAISFRLDNLRLQSNAVSSGLTVQQLDARYLQKSNNLSDLTSAPTARTNLGLAIGSNVQAWDADLDALGGLTSGANKLPYFTGSHTASVTDLSAAGRAILDDADAPAQRTTLGLGTIATQAADNVSITGGAVSGITDLAVADGGTGASTAATARDNLVLFRPWFNLIFCSAFTPAGTGVDVAKFEVPYSPDDGTTSVAWTVRRIWGVCQTGGGTPDVIVELLAGTDVGTLTFGSGATTAAKTSAFDTAVLNSGDILQLNWTDIGTAVNFTIGIMAEKAT